MKLGCTPSAQHDLDRRLWMANYVDTVSRAAGAATPAPPAAEPDAATTPPPPFKVDRSKDLDGIEWGELGNDKFNDCTVAAAGHAAQLVNWLGKNQKLPLPALTQEVVATYQKLARANPTPNHELSPGTVLKYWQETGIADEQCLNYTAIRTQLEDHRDWMTAIDLFGFAYVFVRLSDAVRREVAKGDIRDQITLNGVPDQSKDNGHCVIAVGYDDKVGLKVVSWGKAITWGWDVVTRSGYEAYAVLLPSWASSYQPVGLNEAELTADLQKVKNGQTTPPEPPATR